MKTNFKVGDKVWDAIHYLGQDGRVEEINEDFLTVKFQQTALVQYFLDGRLAMSGKVQTLSKVPYTFEIPEQPVEFEEGDPVLVRDDKTFPWMGARFVRYNEGVFCYVAFEEDGYVCGFKYCILFDIEKMGRV